MHDQLQASVHFNYANLCYQDLTGMPLHYNCGMAFRTQEALPGQDCLMLTDQLLL